MKRIHIPDNHFGQITKKYGVSNQTVLNAIRYITNSQLAKDIRTMAKELLEKELEELLIDAKEA